MCPFPANRRPSNDDSFQTEATLKYMRKIKFSKGAARSPLSKRTVHGLGSSSPLSNLSSPVVKSKPPVIPAFAGFKNEPRIINDENNIFVANYAQSSLSVSQFLKQRMAEQLSKDDLDFSPGVHTTSLSSLCRVVIIVFLPVHSRNQTTCKSSGKMRQLVFIRCILICLVGWRNPEAVYKEGGVADTPEGHMKRRGNTPKMTHRGDQYHAEVLESLENKNKDLERTVAALTDKCDHQERKIKSLLEENMQLKDSRFD